MDGGLELLLLWRKEKMNNYPKTKQGVINLIIHSIKQHETSYISFCKELSETKDSKILNYFCNNHCEIHKLHNSHLLLCLPISCLELLNLGERKQ